MHVGLLLKTNMQGTIPEDAEIPESTLEAWEPFWS
jgi:hypothetical protein